MTAPLHPELAALEAQYNRLIDDYEAGHLTYDQARGLLASLSTVDGGGAVWGMDENGEFVRTRPGGTAEVVDPAHFVAAQLPPRPAAPPWANGGDLLSPPQLPGTGRPAGGGGFAAGRARSIAEAEDPAGPLARHLPGGLGPKASAFFAKNRTTLLIAGAALVLLAVLAPGRPAKPVTGGVPVATTVAGGPATTLAPLPGEAPAAAVPNPEQMQQALNALAGRDTARAVLAEPGDDATVAWRVAQYAGFASAGLQVRTGPAAPDGQAAVSRVEVVDAATGAAVAVGRARWVTRDGRWLLAAWPELDRS